MFRPNFDDYFKEEWSYESVQGVGIKLSGYPNDITMFIDLLQGESCNPVATRRILEELKQNGIKYTTLMSHLNFNRIGKELHNLGVTMEVVAPISIKKINNIDLDSAALYLFQNDKYNIDFNDENQKEVKKRYEEFQQSMNEIPHHFGPYDKNKEISSYHIQLVKRKNHG